MELAARSDRQSRITAAYAGWLRATGTASGQNALRHLASSVGLDLMIFPEVYWTWKDAHFDGSTLTDADAAKFLSGWVDAFASFIDRHVKVAA